MKIVRDDRGVHVAPWEWPSREPARNARALVIADDFTLAAFKYEWHQVQADPQGWPDQLDGIDLLFVESAWAGNGGLWQYQVTGPKAPSGALVDLVGACRERGVPTVFWNKEDPAHFDDFIATAELFDHVWTTDAGTVGRYRERLGHDRVGVLPFAVQPAVHHPLRTLADKPSGVAFAGTWFAHKFPERRAQMELLFPAAAAVSGDSDPFEIWSRFAGKGEQYEFPEPWSGHVVGSLTYDQMLSAYRAYKVFLNVNTVTDSPTMCARRVLEITACGTPVLSPPAAALRPFLGEGVAIVESADEAADTLGRLLSDEHERARLVHLGQRELWRHHTYSHRVDQLLSAFGHAGVAGRRPLVSVVTATRRPEQVAHLLRQVAQQCEVELELLLGTHGFDLTPDHHRLAEQGGLRLRVLPQPTDRPLGAILNDLIAHAEGDVVTKMDDDDLYGPEYLADLLDWRAVSGADVVGKQARFVHLAGSGQTRFVAGHMEHCPSTFVAGPTITVAREAAREVPFPDLPTGEDTGFLRAALEAGMSIAAADRFNFVQMRNAHGAGHTWVATDEDFQRGEVVDGSPFGGIFI
ncbi:glycosyltransferase family protein [Aestuariimicrobium soli]|uniref:glycosyltransferase family protein n=1 Tax=Aestuariimicrobium soli TaxID=2035834 RepID=UPI003EBE20A1